MNALCRTIVFLLACLSATELKASPDPDRLRAAMVFNLAKFTRWPERSEPGITLCVMAGAKIYAHLEAIRGRRIQGRVLEVESVKKARSSCDLMVFGVDQTPEAVVHKSLTIGQSKNFLAAGGMINLDIEKNRMVFDINLKRLRAVDIDLSADVLALAREVL